MARTKLKRQPKSLLSHAVARPQRYRCTAGKFWRQNLLQYTGLFGQCTQQGLFVLTGSVTVAYSRHNGPSNEIWCYEHRRPYGRSFALALALCEWAHAEAGESSGGWSTAHFSPLFLLSLQVKILRSHADIDEAIRVNYRNAVRAALLMLPSDFALRDLFTVRSNRWELRFLFALTNVGSTADYNVLIVWW